jgi:hypothetical protein
MRSISLLGFFFLLSLASMGQGLIRGKITNPINNQPVPFANVLLLNTELGAITNEEGYYEISNIPAGLYNVRASYVGYKSSTAYEIQVSLAKPVQLDFSLTEDAS